MTQAAAAPNRRRELALNLLVAIVSTLVFLAVLEGGARLAGQKPCSGPAPQQTEGAGSKVRAHPIRQYELVPDSTFTFERDVAVRHGLSPDYLDTWEEITYHVNSLGMRGAEASAAKPTDAYRILLLGDSVAFGWGIEEQDTLSAQLQARLHAPVGQRLEVWNAGVPGYATWHELAYLTEKGAALRPDLVVLAFLFNDVDGNSEAAQTEPLGLSRLGQALTLWTRRSAFLCFLRNKALEFRLKTLNPCQGPNCWEATQVDLDGLAAQANRLGSRLVLVSFPMRLQLEPNAEPGYYDRALGSNPQQNYQDVIARLCRERRIPYLDLLPAFQQAMAQQPSTLFLDADHPNAAGSRVAAQAMAEFIEKQ
jgi:lysophospholipase L1-like esterase